MKFEKWLKNNVGSLFGKTVAITGSTGGLGREICCYLLELGADLILLDRNSEKSLAFRKELICAFPEAEIRHIRTELEDMASVKAVCEQLKKSPPDIFIHNAGAYNIPRKKCDTGYDNVFQINFVSPYYITRELMPVMRERAGRIIAVGSIAHNYSKTDARDVDFSTRQASSLVYGNAKRYLMFSLFELFKDEKDIALSVVHPGITFTNITAHYPPLIFAVIKHPMKIIFMKPKKAALCVIKGVFEDCGYCEWIGPKIFDVWGLPRRKKLKTCDANERKRIFETAEEIYKLIG